MMDNVRRGAELVEARVERLRASPRDFFIGCGAGKMDDFTTRSKPDGVSSKDDLTGLFHRNLTNHGIIIRLSLDGPRTFACRLIATWAPNLIVSAWLPASGQWSGFMTRLRRHQNEGWTLACLPSTSIYYIGIPAE